MACCLLLCNEIGVITEYSKSAAISTSGWAHALFFWKTDLLLTFCYGNHYLVNSYILLQFLLFDFNCVLSRCSWKQSYCGLGQIYLPQAWPCTSAPGHPIAQTTGYGKMRLTQVLLCFSPCDWFHHWNSFKIITSDFFVSGSLMQVSWRQRGLKALS